MKTFRVHAEFKCSCEECNGQGLGSREKGEPIIFSDDFKARDGPDAEILAKAKFSMMLDDIVEEFDGEGHEPFLEIQGCEEI